MNRRTISQQDIEESIQPNIQHQQYEGQVIAEYNLSSSDDFKEYQSYQSIPERKSSFSSHEKQNQAQNYDNTKANLDVSQIRKQDIVSTGYRINDLTKLNESKRNTKKIDVNSFLNSDYSDVNLQEKNKTFLQKYKKEQNVLNQQVYKTNHNAYQYLEYLNRHNKMKEKKQYIESVISKHRKIKIYQKIHDTTFEDAKFKFHDRFMPESLKIANNPYKYLKYVKRREQLKNINQFMF